MWEIIYKKPLIILYMLGRINNVQLKYLFIYKTMEPPAMTFHTSKTS